jgi:hypothetical protein
MSRKFLPFAVAGLALLAGPTLAADLPVKAPPPPALAWSWAGFYLGTHGGYGWGRNDFYQVLTLLPPVAIGGVDPKGWVAGGQTGYNWQNGRWVAGVELDGSATGVRGENTPSARFSATQDVKYLGTLRARAGGIPFANADVLLYGTAGLAWERDNRADADLANNPAIRDQPRDHFGWVAGAGGEFRLGATNWIGRIEYLHYDFGMIEGAFQISGGLNNFANTGGRHTIDVVRGGISYKFDQASSPLTAYAAYNPGKAAPPPVAWSWAGFYLGAHGGYGWKRNDFAQVLGDNPPVPGLDSQGGLAGAQAGYNWQYGSWVTGFEVDGSRTWIHGDGASRDFGGVVAGFGDDVKYLGTVRTRVGVATPANAGILLYGTAGLAWERYERNDHRIIAAFTTSSTTPRDHFGWVAGAGGEFRLGASNWIGRVEYLHYDFGVVEQLNSSIDPLNESFIDRPGRHTIDVVRGGISHKFDSAPASSSAYAAYALAAPASPLAWSWAGYYLGAHGGYGWGRNDFAEIISTTPLLTLGGVDSRGWVAGGQAGYNWQFGRWVAGLELDGSATRIRGDAAPVFQDFGGGNSFTSGASNDVKYLGTVRARAGGAPFANADVLLYGTAGLAWERLDRTSTFLDVGPQIISRFFSTITPRNHFGWVAGAGGEVRLGATNWIGRVEYLHYDFGTVEQVRTLDGGNGVLVADKAGRQTIDVVRGGVSYKFAATE